MCNKTFFHGIQLEHEISVVSQNCNITGMRSGISMCDKGLAPAGIPGTIPRFD